MHSAVWVNGGKSSQKPDLGKALVIAMVVAASLLFASISPGASGLPDDSQQQQLNDLLSQLASNAGDQASIDELSTLLNNVVGQANAAIDAGQHDLALNLLDVVQAVNPDHPELKTAQLRLKSLAETQVQLAAARGAMEAGRVDQPENDCAWFFYRQVLDQNPGNQEAQLGLSAVQQDMLARVMGYAQDLDFDSAERLLEDAAMVLEDQAPVELVRSAISTIKADRAAMLESQAIQLMDEGKFSAAEKSLIDLIALGGQGIMVKKLRQRMEEARIYGGFKPGQVIRDHFTVAGMWAPESVIIRAGSYLMGSKSKERGRAENEGPRHRVTFQRGFAMGQHEVSVAEFGAFVSASGFRTDAERLGHSIVYDHKSGRLTEKEKVYWEMDYEGKSAKPGDPVIHVSWDDAHAYVNWLAGGTGKSYRLPSEAEFEYALKAGSKTLYWWGDASPPNVVENITGELDNSGSRRVWAVAFSAYSDKFWGPAPVMSFTPNSFGLFDMGGNLGEWVSDCWHDSYVRAPLDGSAWINKGCDQRVIRGGYWASLPEQTRSAYRRFAKSDYHDARVGFRIARDL